jgi:hypothetical protein
MNQHGRQQCFTRDFCSAAIRSTDAAHQRVEFAEAILGQQGIVGQTAGPLLRESGDRVEPLIRL